MSRRRTWRTVGIGAAVLVRLLAAVWLAVPPLVRSQLEQRGSELLGRDLRVGQVHFGLGDLALTLEGLTVAGPPGATEPLLAIERVHIDLDARSLTKLAPVVESLQIDAPRLQFARLDDGRYDVDDLLR